jgi:transforming growth factor-beta-induced protein
MKNLNKAVMAALILSTSLIACDNDDDVLTPTPTPTVQNIAEIASADSRTDSLVVALAATDLVATFQGSGTFTVFAPTNEAFRNLLATNSAWNRVSDIDKATLTSVLTYHVLGIVVKSTDLSNDLYTATINTAGPNGVNTSLFIETDNGVMINNFAMVSQADIMASNGVIHIIDKVLLPPNVVDIALNDDRFSSLVSALTAYNFTYATVLAGAGPFTIFAPTNDAFTALLNSNPSWNTLSDIPEATLKAVLEYHVVSGANVQASQLSQGQVISTLGGSNLTVDLTNGAQLQTEEPSQGNVNIIITDVQATNGVVHAVQQVLLPQL